MEKTLHLYSLMALFYSVFCAIVITGAQYGSEVASD